MSRRAVLTVAALAVALAGPAAAFSFDNLEPLAAREWYLQQDQAWSFWATRPTLVPVKVAVIDSGIDGTHPEFVGRVVAARSFVGGSPFRDEDGHGTFVAGEIAASPFNNEGIAGLAFNAQLMIAKVVGADGDVSLPAEVAAIHWAVDNGARVINLSLGGVRDPLDSSLDTYSRLEQAAVEYAYSKGAVVVAAVGNGPQSPATPWNFAHYPSALPHVIGVSAIRQNGSVPDYSNRDTVYNDIAAPGDAMFSTIPLELIDSTSPACAGHPYSDCGPFEFRDAIGTSFATPQVSAAAALLLGQDPALRPEQVAWLLERSADDATPATGCSVCPVGRDRFTGWGALDINAALVALTTRPLPAPDHYEPNDDAGAFAHALPPLPRTITATLDYWDDNIDVYRVHLDKGRRLFARVTPDLRGSVHMALWAPGTARVEGLNAQQSRLAQSRAVGGQARLAYRAVKTGIYYLELKLVRKNTNPVSYRLALTRGN
jgi:subtilisin family serine protease